MVLSRLFHSSHSGIACSCAHAGEIASGAEGYTCRACGLHLESTDDVYNVAAAKALHRLCKDGTPGSMFSVANSKKGTLSSCFVLRMSVAQQRKWSCTASSSHLHFGIAYVHIHLVAQPWRQL